MVDIPISSEAKFAARNAMTDYYESFKKLENSTDKYENRAAKSLKMIAWSEL